ncbi:MAG: ABC transporter permease subunit, partial [Acidimicrobiia bacterium]
MTVQVREHQKTPLWRNATFLKWATQLVVLGAFLAVTLLLVNRAFANFAERGTELGWDWLTDPSDFLVFEGIDLDPDSGIRALAVGAINTLRVTILGIIVATILGTIIGVGRLSSNWIVNKISTIYIETIRNIPLLVQIFFWQAIAITLPGLEASDIGEYWFKSSNKGFGFAWFNWLTGFIPWLVFIIVGIIAGGYVSKWRLHKQEETGKPGHSQRWALGTLLVFTIVGWFAWPILSFLEPVFAAIADFVEGLPPILVPIVIAVLAIVAAGWWIRNFFESRRTPAGFGKLTDDDWFRVIFAGFSGIFVAVLAFVLSGLTMETV